MQHSLSTALYYRKDLAKEPIMLVLTRRIGQTLFIGDEVTVTVLDVSGRQVRIGVQADRHIPIHRGEISGKVRSRSLEDAPVVRHASKE
jgi:carbon storage regulator